ncbi:MAG TPA: hypothetical protein VKF63_04025 [Terracidiphilus sp.]|nr:hypothetical protein [Terracidiphilus sp.]
MRIVTVFLAVVLAATTALAQQSVPPPPQPPADGPTLAATMQFIQDKLNDLGKVSYVAFEQDTSKGDTTNAIVIHEISNVVADPNQCRISYHLKGTRDGHIWTDDNRVFSLRDVQEIVVMPLEQNLNEIEAQIGHPNLITSINPSLILLMAHIPHNWEDFLFSNADLANRVAKSMLHAVELCGGGSKPEALALTTATAQAQPAVPSPLKPANDAPANAEVLKLLRAGVSERAILHVISDAAGTFDTSAEALAALKQAGASEAELSAIVAQGGTPASPPAAGAPTNSGPSLAETMKFIQEKLNGLGKVAFIDFRQNASSGSTWTSTFTNEISNVVADQNQCRISYHWKLTNDGETYKDKNSVFSLRDAQEIVVKPLEQYETEFYAKNGYPNSIVTSTSPHMTALEVRLPRGEENFFLFSEVNTFLFADADLADRVAKAMVHAVELCGGGPKPEPF